MTSPESTLSNSTRSRLLDGAERSLLSRGYTGASIRRIALEAGANVASVNYHFGSKRALFAALFRRRMKAVAQRREKALQAIEASAEIAADAVVQAYFGALFHLRERAGQAAVVVVWVLLASERDASRFAGKCIDDGHVGLRRRYAQALAPGIPDVPVAELEHRLEILERFALCAMAGPNACWTAGSHDASAAQPDGSLSDDLISIIRDCIRAPYAARKD